jgi:hypothetical protein
MADKLFDYDAAKALFHEASVWRGAVIGGVVFTVLVIFFPPTISHTHNSYTPPGGQSAYSGGPVVPPKAGGQAPPVPSASNVPNSAPATATTGPLLPVAPAVPKIKPSADVDAVQDDAKSGKDAKAGEFAEVKGDAPNGNHVIKPSEKIE